MKINRKMLAAVLFAFAAGVAITQPLTSNWMEQGGIIWHIGGDLDIETGGEIDVEAGSALRLQNAGTVVLAAGSTTAVVTGLSLTDTAYSVYFEPTDNVSIMSTSSKLSTGFTVTYQTATGSPTVRYHVFHH